MQGGGASATHWRAANKKAAVRKPTRRSICDSAEITTESGAATTETFGAIVQASGFVPYDASRLPEFAYGKSPNVVSNLELEKLAKEAGCGPIKRPSDGREVKSVAFIQCAGQRSKKEGHLPYCSGFCCTTSIKQAMYFKDQNPDIDTNVIFSDLRTPGAGGEDFYRSGQNKGVTFTKGVVNEVVAGGDGLEVFDRLELIPALVRPAESRRTAFGRWVFQLAAKVILDLALPGVLVAGIGVLGRLRPDRLIEKGVQALGNALCIRRWWKQPPVSRRAVFVGRAIGSEGERLRPELFKAQQLLGERLGPEQRAGRSV